MSENLKRKFTGVFIPARIWEAVNLTWLEKCLLAEIDALEDDDRGCWASNQYLADLFGSSVKSIDNMLRRLRQFGHITVSPWDGFKRSIRICRGGIHEAVDGGPPSGGGGIHPAVDSPYREIKEEKKGKGKVVDPVGKKTKSIPPQLPPKKTPNGARPPFDTERLFGELPTSFGRSEEFCAGWDAFVARRKQPWTERAIDVLVQNFKAWGVAGSVASLNAAEVGGYQSLFPPSGKRPTAQTSACPRL